MWCLRVYLGDFPVGPVIKNLPSNAGDLGSIPGRGTKSPRAVGQLSARTPTTEPVHSGAPSPQLQRSLRATMKSLVTAMKDPVCHN